MVKEPQKEAYLIRELEVLVTRLGIQVRYERLTDAQSGLCILKGTSYLIIDTDSVPEQILDIFRRALSDKDLTNMYLPPVVREFLSL